MRGGLSEEWQSVPLRLSTQRVAREVPIKGPQLFSYRPEHSVCDCLPLGSCEAKIHAACHVHEVHRKHCEVDMANVCPAAAEPVLTLHPAQSAEQTASPQNPARSPKSRRAKASAARLCLLRGVDGLVHAVCPLLLRDHDDEALEVGECPPLLDGGALLGEARLLPLLDDRLLLELLADDTGAGGAGERSEAEGSEGQVAVGEGLAGDAGCWAVDDSLRSTSGRVQYFALW